MKIEIQVTNPRYRNLFKKLYRYFPKFVYVQIDKNNDKGRLSFFGFKTRWYNIIVSSDGTN